jgi:hypothetical protein
MVWKRRSLKAATYSQTVASAICRYDEAALSLCHHPDLAGIRLTGAGLLRCQTVLVGSLIILPSSTATEDMASLASDFWLRWRQILWLRWRQILFLGFAGVGFAGVRFCAGVGFAGVGVAGVRFCSLLLLDTSIRWLRWCQILFLVPT